MNPAGANGHRPSPSAIAPGRAAAAWLRRPIGTASDLEAVQGGGSPNSSGCTQSAEEGPLPQPGAECYAAGTPPSCWAVRSAPAAALLPGWRRAGFPFPFRCRRGRTAWPIAVDTLKLALRGAHAVARDDLARTTRTCSPEQWAAIRRRHPQIAIEVLTLISGAAIAASGRCGGPSNSAWA